MERSGTPDLVVYVWGDWDTVSLVRKYREVLLGQEPDDEVSKLDVLYKIPCNSTEDLVTAYMEFRAYGLRCAFGILFESEDKSFRVHAATGNGFESNKPEYDVTIVNSESAGREAENIARDAKSEDTDLRVLMSRAHQTAVDKGWWNNRGANIGAQLTNMHSELSEAWEEIRDNRPLEEIYYSDSKIGPKPEGVAVEFADVLVRIFDTCEYYGIPLVRALNEKMAYNERRSWRHGGKLA